MFRLLALRLTFTTSAVVATRTMQIAHRGASAGADTANRILNRTQTASTAFDYYFDQTWPLDTDLSGGFNVMHNNLFDVYVMPADILKTTVVNLQAGDTITSIIGLIREWIID